MTNVDLVNISAAMASLVLAVVAIWLSIVFYRLTVEESKKAAAMLNATSTTIEILKEKVEKLSSDLFAMIQEIVADFRKHAWPESTSSLSDVRKQIDERASEKMAAFKEEMLKELNKILESQAKRGDHASSEEFKRLIEKAISGSQRLRTEAGSETVRDHILRTIKDLAPRNGEKVSADAIVRQLRDNIPSQRILEELETLSREGYIDCISPVTPTCKIALKSSRSDVRLF